MPCQSPTQEEFDRASYAYENQKLTALCCKLMTVIESKAPTLVLELTAEELTWWQRHQKYDQERTARQQRDAEDSKLRAVTLRSLTAEQLRVCGLSPQ